MSKLLLSAILLAAVLVPAVQAQEQAAYTVDVEIEDLPASRVSNTTQIVVPFNVTAAISGAAPCLGALNSDSTFTITLAAAVTNTTGGNSSFAYVNPRQVTVAGPRFVPAAGGDIQREDEATLVVNAGPYSGDALNVTVLVTATFSGSNGGCTGVPNAAPDSAEATFRANFQPVRGFGGSASSGAEMPGPAFAFLLLALVGAVAVGRRYD